MAKQAERPQLDVALSRNGRAVAGAAPTSVQWGEPNAFRHYLTCLSAQCDRVTGEDCFIALAHVGSVAELERVIDRIIPYAMTNTAIIQSSPVEPRSPLGVLRER